MGRNKSSSLSRAEARQNGQVYYQGKPCKNCGGTHRYVSSCTCVTCQSRIDASRPPREPKPKPLGGLVKSDRLRRELEPVYREVWEDEL